MSKFSHALCIYNAADDNITIIVLHLLLQSNFFLATHICRFLSTSAVNETSIRVVIQHGPNVHPGYCRGDKCDEVK